MTATLVGGVLVCCVLKIARETAGVEASRIDDLMRQYVALFVRQGPEVQPPEGSMEVGELSEERNVSAQATGFVVVFVGRPSTAYYSKNLRTSDTDVGASATRGLPLLSKCSVQDVTGQTKPPSMRDFCSATAVKWEKVTRDTFTVYRMLTCPSITQCGGSDRGGVGGLHRQKIYLIIITTSLVAAFPLKHAAQLSAKCCKEVLRLKATCSATTGPD